MAENPPQQPLAIGNAALKQVPTITQGAEHLLVRQRCFTFIQPLAQSVIDAQFECYGFRLDQDALHVILELKVSREYGQPAIQWPNLAKPMQG